MAEPESPELVLNSDLRLRVCAALYGVNRSTFADLVQDLGVSVSSMSKCLKALETAGYVVLDKQRSGRSYTTVVALTPEGISGYEARREYLRTILAD